MRVSSTMRGTASSLRMPRRTQPVAGADHVDFWQRIWCWLKDIRSWMSLGYLLGRQTFKQRWDKSKTLKADFDWSRQVVLLRSARPDGANYVVVRTSAGQPAVARNATSIALYGQRTVEIDTRLRPSGKGGLMVTQVRAFEEYQRHEAWTWEHQALLRAGHA